MISSPKQYLETANRIGARICRDAVWSGNRCNWLGYCMEKLDGYWKVDHRALGPDFYGGTSGIALFVGRLHAVTGERVLWETAEGGILEAWSRIPHLAPAIRASLYLGVTGIAYTLTAMGLEAKAREALSGLTGLGPPSTDAQGDNLDVIGGIAGAIPPLIEMGRALSDNALVALAINYGEDLLRLAKKSAAGWSWNTMRVPPAQRQQDLTGFSHGAAGIAWALSELFQYPNDAGFLVAAAENRLYESSHFNSQISNWAYFTYLFYTEFLSE